jgi:mannosylglycerate hydrolase
MAPDVAGFGWRTFTPAEGEAPAPALQVGDTTLANDHLAVQVDPVTGTFSIRTADGVEVAGLDRLVDDGDGGDTYSYSPPSDDVFVDEPAFARVTKISSGPVRGRLLVERVYEVPAFAIGDERVCTRRSEETVHLEVHTTLELRPGERFVRVHTELDNRARDHRLRTHFPLPARVAGSEAECAFAVVHRGLTAEGGPHEFGLPTFVSRRFVDCSDGDMGLAVLHDGLLEYEVLDEGREVALTLLRATGYLSRSDPALRPNPAGPLDPLQGPQLQGRHVVEYALLPHLGDWQDARLHDAADELLVPLERVRAGGVDGAARPPAGRALRVEGSEVSALLRVAGWVVLRVFNASPEPSTATVEHDGAPARGWRINLLGRTEGPFEGSVALRPWEIATLRVG